MTASEAAEMVGAVAAVMAQHGLDEVQVGDVRVRRGVRAVARYVGPTPEARVRLDADEIERPGVQRARRAPVDQAAVAARRAEDLERFESGGGVG